MVTVSGAYMIKASKDGGFVRIQLHCSHYLPSGDTIGMGDKGASHSASCKLIELGRQISQSMKGSKLLRAKQAYVGVPQHHLIQVLA